MKKIIIFITIFLSVILSQFIFINNVKADSIINGITISDDFYFPRYEDIICPPSESDCSNTLLNKISSNYIGNYHLQCWYSMTPWSGSSTSNINDHSEIYCYVGDVTFVPYLHWQNGQNTNQYNPDGFTINGTPWINSSSKNYYSSLAIYRWNYEDYTWDTICANWNNTCIYNVIGYNQYPIVNYSNVSGDTSTPIFKTDIWYTSDRWNAPLFQGNLRPHSDLPNFLNGYREVVLNIDEVNLLLSGLSSGSIYIPYDSFMEYGGRLSYFVKDVPYQAWDTVIDDYYIMDSLYVRQDFDISNYPNASYVMFSKYLYLEGEDNISYSIYIPNDMYSSLLTATLNNNGGYDYTYEVVDQQGNIQEESFTSLDYGISPSSPLLSDLFSDFSSNTFGLTAIVVSPLNLISSITSSSCSSLDIPLPYINRNLTLPCMSTIYQNTFGSFFGIYQSVTFGIISYWVIVKIFNLVKDFKNPEHDEIEVLDL